MVGSFMPWAKGLRGRSAAAAAVFALAFVLSACGQTEYLYPQSRNRGEATRYGYGGVDNTPSVFGDGGLFGRSASTGQAEGGSGDLPLADRVEAFVRERDLALLEVVHHQGEVVVQHLVVESLALDVELPAARFTVDGRGLRLRDVQEHAPSWEQVEQVLRQAEVRAEREAEASNAKLPAEPPRPPERRPSRR